jgi:alkaline phosphatase
MKWRNQLLALFCLLGFAGLGILYFQHWVVQKPFGIILFVGEGLTPSRMAAARIFAGGADVRLAMDSLSHSALLTNYSNDFATPDRAAAASALATGTKVNNGTLGVDPAGKKIANILELAREVGRATGLITNANLTDPTAAAFYAHSGKLEDKEGLARELVEGRKLDLVLGGGAAQFLPESKNGRRRDEADLLMEVRRNGFDLVRAKGELEAVPGWRHPKLFGVFSDVELAFPDEIEARADQPDLSDMVRRGIELLQFNPAGYVLVVDAGLMRKAAEANNGERTLAETVELDRAVSVALRYMGRRSTLLVCGDVATGGLSLSGFPYRKDSRVALLGLNAGGNPWLTWATGPNGARAETSSRLDQPADANDATPPIARGQTQEPAAVYADAALNTAEDVILLGTGPGSEGIRGSMDNTAVFTLIHDNL